ncbi:GNAT family N-acetyltransferase [Microbacteriaceae bacterium VKM Ac-2855]|nr:GNAT family N-acetyltransferase [Microbacteriaceae bacterium VKM Ac-2855]
MDEAVEYGTGLLEGERIRLRSLADPDLPALVRWWADPAWAVLQQGAIRPQRAEQIAELFRSWSINSDASAVGFSVEAGGQLIGHVALFGAALPTRIGTLGIVIRPEFVSKGLGTEALRTVLRYGFAEMGLNKVELRVWSFNERAIAAYEKAGFVREGVRRAATFHSGAFHDEVLYGILAEEFTAAR